MTASPAMPPSSASVDLQDPDGFDQASGERRQGLRTAWEGLGIALGGGFALWLSFWLADGAKTILGAGPLIGGGMIGYGAVQMVFGDRLRWLRWIAAAVAGFVILAATIVVLDLTLGVTFA